MKLQTELGKSYWGNRGTYQEQYDKLYNELVPSSGEAETKEGEMIRCISRLYYDFCNNGNCNVLECEYDVCYECDGGGEIDESYYDFDDEEYVEEHSECNNCGGSGEDFHGNKVNQYYQGMLDFLHENMEVKTNIEALEKWLKSNEDTNYDFTDTEMNRYDKVVDDVVYQILNH